MPGLCTDAVAWGRAAEGEAVTRRASAATVQGLEVAVREATATTVRGAVVTREAAARDLGAQADGLAGRQSGAPIAVPAPLRHDTNRGFLLIFDEE